VRATAQPAALVSDDDRAAVVALRAGDEAVFGSLHARHSPAMRRVARSVVRSETVAEEVVQETWLAVLNGIDEFECRSSLATWIFSILANQARRHAAREGRAVPLSGLGPDEDSGGPAVDPDRFQGPDDAWPGHWATPPRPWQKPERRLFALEARERLKRALAELPERQRLVVALRDVEGCAAEEVCAALGLSAENQRVLLHRARSRLRAALEDYIDGSEGVA
jgi:RNA polymerase sigma-70 factor (ECF subfamily)